MPATSKKQRRFMAMCEHGKKTNKPCPKMSKSQMHDFAKTKEKGLPKESMENFVKRRNKRERRG